MENENTRKEHLEVILTLWTGRHLCDELGFTAFREFMSWISGEPDLREWGLYDAAETAKPFLAIDLPFLNEIPQSDPAWKEWDYENDWKPWRTSLIEKYGKWHEVHRTPPDDRLNLSLDKQIELLKEQAPHLTILPLVPDDDNEEISPYGDINWKADD